MHVDYLIIGQGLAGSMMSWFLLNEDKSILVIDPDLEVTSSKIGAGIFNPVTGRRINKTWLADDLFPFADQTYRTIEERFKTNFWHPKPIARIFASPKEQNDWLARSGEPAVSRYMSDDVRVDENVISSHGVGGIRQGGWLDIPSFLDAIRSWLSDQKALITDHFNLEELTIADSLQWKDVETQHVIFCEGHCATNNPWFNWLPFSPAKGELVTVAMQLSEDQILNRGNFVLPMGNGYFKIGATFQHDYSDELPTPENKTELLDGLARLTHVPYKVVDHTAAIRPTTLQRKPFVGKHPENEQLSILNGFGTKGVTLAPYFANQLTRHLLYNEPINEEADIRKIRSK